MNEVLITGVEAIEAFKAAHAGGLIQTWFYSPNGGYNRNDVLTQEQFAEWIRCERDCSNPEGDIEQVWPNISFDGEKLEFWYTPGYSVHRYATFYVESTKGFEGEAVACCGADYGFMWGPSCKEIAEYRGEFAKTRVLEEALNYTCDFELQKMALLGLGLIGDPTDDGHNWIVIDPAKFGRLAAMCKKADDKFNEWDLKLECWSEEGLAELIVDHLCK